MDVLGSYAADCFALLMPSHGLSDALRLADGLSESLLQYIALSSGNQPAFTLSVGVVQAIDTDDATSVLKRAEMALDTAASKGGDRIYCHDGEHVVPIAKLLEMEAATYHA